MGWPISQWWPKDRPRARPASLAFGDCVDCLAPAAQARAKTDRDRRRRESDGPSIQFSVSGLKLACSGDSSASQNSAPSPDGEARDDAAIGAVETEDFACVERRLVKLQRLCAASELRAMGRGCVFTHSSATHRLRNSPSPSMATTTSAPGVSHFGGLWARADTRRSPCGYDVAGLEVHDAQKEFDQLGNFEDQLAGVRILELFAVHGGGDAQVMRVGDFVGSGIPGPWARCHRSFCPWSTAKWPVGSRAC